MMDESKNKLSILIVEDNRADRRLAEIAIAEGCADVGLSYQISQASSLAEGLEQLSPKAARFDAILLDLGLPDSTGFSGLVSISLEAPEVPILVLTGNSDPAVGIEALKHGASDYLSKAELMAGPLLRAIRYAIERKQNEIELLRLAQTDSLTGLLNRRAFFSRLADALSESENGPDGCAVFLVDIDHFKEINDVYGHRTGDNFLRQVAEDLTAAFKDTCAISRIGGDEFALLASRLSHEDEISSIAERIAALIAAISVTGDARVMASASVGAAAHFGGPIETAELLARADMAMYKTKADNRGSVRVFDDALHAEAQQVNDLLRKMPTDIADGRFFLEYQPLVDARTHEVIKAEALARWRDANGDLVSPVQFIPIAEKSDLISRLGRTLLDQACRQMREWLDAGVPPVPVSINVSPVQFRDPQFGQTFLETLETYALQAEMFRIEITESTIMSDVEQLQTNLNLLRSHGMKVMIDDFGTGHSSLALLRDLPFDTLKIDKSFVTNLGSDHEANAMIEAIVAMAKRLDFRVVAEGVETGDQADFLSALGVDALQGYFFHRPMGAEPFMDLLLAQRGQNSQAA